MKINTRRSSIPGAFPAPASTEEKKKKVEWEIFRVVVAAAAELIHFMLKGFVILEALPLIIIV